jgi:hypothetical protein
MDRHEGGKGIGRRAFAAAIALGSLAAALHAQATEQRQITTPNGTSTQRCGLAMSVDGDLMVVGAPFEDTKASDAGAADVFRFDAATAAWVFEQQLFASDAEASARFGSAVGADGNVIVVGSPYKDTTKGTDSGQIYVFRYNTSTHVWSQEQKFTASVGGANDHLGAAVAISGNGILAGAPQADTAGGTDAGVAVVFRYQNAIVKWVEEAQLIDPDGYYSDYAGAAVAIDGGTALVGSPASDEGSTYDSGSVGVWTVSGTTWTQVQEVLPATKQNYANFGTNVRVDGASLVVGAPSEDESATVYDSGAIYAFALTSGAFVQEARITATTPVTYTYFGNDAAVHGDLLVVGYQNDTVSGKGGCGSAHLFRRAKKTGIWVFDQQLGASDSFGSDHFGVCVGLNDREIVVAADGNDTAAGSDWGVVYGFDATEIALAIAPTHPLPGESVTFSAYRGDPGDPVMVTVEDVGGTFMFQPLLIYVFAADHTLTFSADAPDPLFGITIGMKAYKISPTGGVAVSEFSYLDI